MFGIQYEHNNSPVFQVNTISTSVGGKFRDVSHDAGVVGI
jgi:hypothetical protein